MRELSLRYNSTVYGSILLRGLMIAGSPNVAYSVFVCDVGVVDVRVRQLNDCRNFLNKKLKKGCI